MRLMMLEACSDGRHPWISALQTNGFRLDLFPLLSEGEEALQQLRYAMLLVNSKLPDGNGIDWLRSRRRSDPCTPLVMITPAHDVENRIRALDAGADDAVPDTLDARELVARLRAVLRRNPFIQPDFIEKGSLRFDLTSREVLSGDAPVAIPRRELDILEMLMLSFGRTVTREFLEGSVYGVTSDICSNSIEVRVSRLRRLLAQANASVEIKTIRGLGYRLQMREEGADILDK
jgi:two-component system, OmpR family, response regulator